MGVRDGDDVAGQVKAHPILAFLLCTVAPFFAVQIQRLGLFSITLALVEI